MFNLASYLQNLFFLHEQIGLEGIGFWRATQEDSYWEQRTGLLHPPKRIMQFEEDKNAQTSVYIHRVVAQAEGWDLEKAKQEVNAQIQQWRTQLASDGAILELMPLGRLYRQHGKILFVAEQDNFSAVHFGLPSFSTRPIFQSISRQDLTLKPIIGAGRRKLPWLQIVAVIGVVLLLGVAYWGFSGQHWWGTSSEKVEEVPPRDEPEATFPSQIDTTPAPQTETIVPQKDTLVATPPPSSQTYTLALGAFGNTENANRLVQGLQAEGYQTETTVTASGYTRVLVKVSCTPEALPDIQSHLKENYKVEARVQ